MQLILGQFNIVKRYIFETVQGALLFASLLFCFFLRFQVLLIIHFDITVQVFFFSTAVDFTTPLMIANALWVSYVTRNAFFNALASFFFPSFILTEPDITPIFIFNSIIINGSFYQIFKYCFYSALPEQKVGYVSFARVFFLSTL